MSQLHKGWACGMMAGSGCQLVWTKRVLGLMKDIFALVGAFPERNDTMGREWGAEGKDFPSMQAEYIKL